MKIIILCPYWGHEHMDMALFLKKIVAHGFDGVDTWIPTDKKQRHQMYKFIAREKLHFVAHQHRAEGATFARFCRSFKKELHLCAEAGPVLINSHTGRDYFSREQFLTLFEISTDFTRQTGITVSHETHRGRFGYSPQMIQDYLHQVPDLCITADFSHWTCVTESLLTNFENILNLTISHTRAIHARIGYEQGPQITNPKDPLWASHVEVFFSWWDKIIAGSVQRRVPILPITTEFGPFPYMAACPTRMLETESQFAMNNYMKERLRTRYHLPE